MQKRASPINPHSKRPTQESLRGRPGSLRNEATGLEKLARAVGIQTSYTDMAGKVRHARAETLKALISYWGLHLDSMRSIQETLHHLELERLRQVLPPVAVFWNGKSGKISLQLPGGFRNAQLHVSLKLEDGSLKKVPSRLISREVITVKGERFVTTQLLVPQLPLGYHSLEVELAESKHRCLLVAAPELSYSPPYRLRELGLFVPMYALHSRNSWGAGNLQDWTEFSRWAADCDCKVVATLPLLSNFLGKPVCEPSPYSPATRLFWNEFYTAIEQAPEFTRSPAVRKWFNSADVQRELKRFRSAALIDYAPQMAIRRQALELMATHFFTNVSFRHCEFQKFVKQRPELSDYAEFRAMCEKTEVSWHAWSERARTGHIQPQDFDESCKQYHLYCQWVIHQQMTAFLSEARMRTQHFYLDLPLGVHPNGYDMWRYRESFAFPADAGAPPDAFFTKGQNWGFAPLHPMGLRNQRYQYWLEFLRFQMRHTGLLRIDHVMGLHRLYWIPKGFPASDGAYVSYPADELYAILCLESHRHKTVLVGENLGTVPPEVNREMARHAFREIYALQYEQRPDPRQPARVPPRHSVAAINTHDMPTFTAHFHGKDISLRSKLGLLTRSQQCAEVRKRKKLNAALVSFLVEKGLLKKRSNEPIQILTAILRFLSGSPAEIVLVTLEDLWGEVEPQNTPGTYSELPNWRRKIRLSLEEILNSPHFKELLIGLANVREQSANTPSLQSRRRRSR